MQFAGKLLPVSYVFEGLRRIIAGGTVPGTSLMWGLDLAVAYVLLAFIETPPEPASLRAIAPRA